MKPDNEMNKEIGHDREYVLDIKRCMIRSCEGELAEMSYYERNNWVTVEYKCARCGKEFTVKVEH